MEQTTQKKRMGLLTSGPKILLACVILVFVFGLGMYVQSRRAVAEDDLYSACVNMEEHLSSPETCLLLTYFQALETPMEDPGMKAEMAHVRRWAARIFEAELAYSLEEADVPVTHAYLYALSEELLGSSCPDAAVKAGEPSWARRISTRPTAGMPSPRWAASYTSGT